ncbi:MAG: hypothetical protein K9H58_12935 [Bacteroidales bacterium]|nr:hypothetical protein [Bacteroidales bacterium]
MKTKTIIVFYLILFVIGLAMASFAQGIVNDGGYINGNTTNYVKISGSGDAYLIGTTADQTTFGHLDIDFSGTGTYDLIITDSSYITIDGNLTLSDSLRLQADTNSMASLITNGTVTGSFGIVEEHLTQDQWHMISSPVSSALADVYTGCYLLKWGESDSTWSYITSLSDPLTTTKGYFVWSESSISSPTDVEYSGLLNTGNQTATGLTYTSGSGKGNGWNLVGNPYPSALEWTSTWTKSNIDATMYIYDGTQYLTWNYNLGGYGTLGNGYIPSTQAFWVKANASGPSLTIPNSQRTHASQSFYKGSEDTYPNIFSGIVEGNGYIDKAIIGMNDYATNNFDSEFDAYKLFGIEDAPQLFASINTTKASTNIFETITSANYTVDLGLIVGASEKYILEFGDLENFDPQYNIYLEDKLSSPIGLALYNLRKNPIYKFNAEPGQVENRFKIHFVKTSESKEPTMPGKDSNTIVNIYSHQKDVYVNYLSETGATAVVYDIMGREITRKSIEANQLNKIQVSAERGYYIVKIISSLNTSSSKVYLN